MENSAPAMILVEPQIGENIGAAARAMLNFGLTDLRLVAPRDGWPNEVAAQNAAGALEKMPDVQVFDTLAEAVADLHFVFATTARHRDMIKLVYTPQAAMQEAVEKVGGGQRVGIVFGRERTGLENDDIALCQAIVSAPVNPDFASLNLGQSVLMMSYAWTMETYALPAQEMHQGDRFPVRHEDLQDFLGRLEGALEESGFFRSEGLKPTMVRNVQNIFTRAELTDQEVRTLHGIVSALKGNKAPID